MEHLAIFHWFSKYNFVCIPVLAFLLDLIIGDPNSKYHPVAIIGRIISFFEAVLYKDTDNDTKKLWYGGIAVGLILISVYLSSLNVFSSRRFSINFLTVKPVSFTNFFLRKDGDT